MGHSVVRYGGLWTEKQIRHLLRRTLFGISRDDWSFFKAKSMDEAIEVLLTQSAVPPAPIIETDDSEIPKGKSFVLLPKSKVNEEGRTLGVKAWWIGLMIEQDRSITQRMVLFWHNHFVTEFNKVNDSRYSFHYLQLLQANALGNFKTLALGMTLSPQMLVYLNGNENNKSAPNENYARELQELFSVGKGSGSHYIESDVKAAARVLTGWKDDVDTITSYFDSNNHDIEDKVFSSFYNNHVIKGRVGNEGAAEANELVDMVFGQEEVAKFICRKLYRWFVNSVIDKEVETGIIEPLARILITSNYEIKPVLVAIFSADFFYNPYLNGSIVKSPLDYVMGLFREFNVPLDGNYKKRWTLLWHAAIFIGNLGQSIGDPPNVAGWPAYYEDPLFYRTWITSENLVSRNIMIGTLLFPKDIMAQFVVFDFIKFVSTFNNLEISESLINDILGHLCAVSVGKEQLGYMDQLLNPDSLSPWSELWNASNADIDNEVKVEIDTRLKSLFNHILTLPEYQIL